MTMAPYGTPTEEYIDFVSEIVEDHRAEILAHYHSELPNECVGLVWADGGIKRLVNQARSPDRFSISRTQMAEQMAARPEFDLLVAIYHSHPDGSPRLSKTDEDSLRTQFRKDLFIPWVVVTPYQMILYWLNDQDKLECRTASLGMTPSHA